MVINIKPQYVVRKIYCDPFSHVMDRCQYTRQLQQQQISFSTRSMHNSLYIAGRSEYDFAHAQWPLCLPFPHIHLFYVTPALIRGHVGTSGARSQFPPPWECSNNRCGFV